MNSVVVWSHQGPGNVPLSWKNAGNIVIGKNLNGNGVDKAILDNLLFVQPDRFLHLQSLF